VDLIKPRLLVRVLLIPLVLFVSSCGLMNRTRSMFGGQLPIQVSIASDANENTPLAVDFVVVYEKKVLDKLLEKKARDWFAGRDQFLRDYPDGVKSWKWEWVPGQEIQPIEIAYGVGAKQVVLFADYLAPGEHRARIDPQRPFRLILGPSELEVEELQ
jgi:type VI secretion system protein